jgi:hypothetical protein
VLSLASEILFSYLASVPQFDKTLDLFLILLI